MHIDIHIFYFPIEIYWTYFRDAEISRQKEYERELQEMMERIESRPLLFERESQVSQSTKITRIIMTGRKHAKIVLS